MLERTGLIQRFKEETTAAHAGVDQMVSGYNLFSDKKNYGKFLQIQEIFHRIVDKTYHNKLLNEKIPGLEKLARHDRVKNDMKTLGVEEYAVENLPELNDLDESLGWLYCAEGSNIGAALLLKGAEQLGFSAEKGASHLAPHPNGRKKFWHEFLEQYKKAVEGWVDEDKVIQGAKNAFSFYAGLAQQVFSH